MKNFREMMVGEIVAKNIEYAKVLQSHQIDFCCGGNIQLTEAVRNGGADLEEVVRELEGSEKSQSIIATALRFDSWSLDLLMDYILKFHHDYIRRSGPTIQALIGKVVKAHAETDPHLKEVERLFGESLIDLENHLGKEEEILFPLIYKIIAADRLKAPLPQSHCGSVANPINMMMQEHDNEGARYRIISELTNSYTPPIHACDSYKLMLHELKQFEDNLHIHIHVENNILFLKAIELENSLSR